VAGRSETIQNVAGRLQAIHDEMIARNAGPLALTIAEVAANLDRLSATAEIAQGRRAKARASTDPNPGHLMIGGIAGALAGFAAGGPVGAGIGFVAGWVGRGFMEAC
jgi:hypothetical protein